MNTIKTCLATIAMLVCSVTVNAATYSDWTSTNQGQSNSASSNIYSITASAGDVLTFDWEVSSESNYDKFIVTLDGTEILSKSGVLSGTYQHTFNSSGNHTMVVKYTKDGSLDKNGDYAKVYNIVLSRTNSGNGDTGNVIASGTYYGTNLTWKLTNKGELIIEGTGDITVDRPWFTYREDIKSVSIPEGVTSIGYFAFSGCSNLTAITIPENVTSIANNAFNNCSSLTSITIDANNKVYDSRNNSNAIIETNSNTLILGCSATIIPEGVTSIGYGAFENCSSLTSITIPEGVTNIGDCAFSGCSSLTSITIPKGVTNIGDRAFSGCSSLTSITIPEGVTNIGDRAFSGCSSLTSITIPEGVTSIGFLAFSSCNNLTAIIISESVTSIGDHAFSGCSSLTSITIDANNTVYDSRNSCNAIIETNSNILILSCSATIIPEGVTSIGASAFSYCSNLTSITIPKSVTSIEEGAFAYCSSLTAITIPESVTTIGEEAFSNCISLTSIICKTATPPTIDSQTFFNVNKEIPVYVNASSVFAYQSAVGWCEFTNIQAARSEKKILDSEENFAQTENEECASITYTRTFNNTNFQALYVPFEIPVTEEFLADFEVADLNDVRQYDRDDDGVKDETVIEAFKVTSGVLEANYPYLIRAKEAGEKTITVTDATLFAAEENSIDCSSVREKFTFTGTYSQLSSEELPQGEGYYALSGGIWRPVAEGTSLGAFRFYLKVDSRSALNAGQGNAIRMRIIGEDGEEDDATGIDNLEFENQNSESIFDLQGRRVKNPTKGVYIVNGVKRVF